MTMAVWPVTPTSMPVAASMAGAAARMSATSWTVSALLGALLGMTLGSRCHRSALNTGGRDEQHVREGRDVGRHGLRRGRGIGDARGVKDHRQRAVEARPEAGRDQVVCLALVVDGPATLSSGRPSRRSSAGRAMTTQQRRPRPRARATAGAR